MSARVFNPFALFEMRGTMRGAGVEGLGGDRRSRLRANLFGPVDHEEVKRDLGNELAEQARRDAEKYNFDFTKEKPIEGSGRFVWEHVVSTVPAPYELRGMSYIQSHAQDARTTSDASSSGSSAAQGDGRSVSCNSTTPEPEPKLAPATSSSSKQSLITNYHPKRKRLLTQGKSSPATKALFKKARVQEH